ncbi:MAG: hypothetical protein MUE44_35870 [Oscillatoriaceae cyanobacterium Prado104]|jgi:outer membrane murein-binding lipoprotein Lpp|nr:hypothetical protein [Oscillatoriaceae cyanobacterium Prado104]
MVATPPAEPTLTDVMEKLDRLSTSVDNLTTRIDKLTISVDNLTTRVDTVSKSKHVDNLATDVEKFNDRFSQRHQATKRLVQLAFTLIASATVTVIITSVLRR